MSIASLFNPNSYNLNCNDLDCNDITCNDLTATNFTIADISVDEIISKTTDDLIFNLADGVAKLNKNLVPHANEAESIGTDLLRFGEVNTASCISAAIISNAINSKTGGGAVIDLSAGTAIMKADILPNADGEINIGLVDRKFLSIHGNVIEAGTHFLVNGANQSNFSRYWEENGNLTRSGAFPNGNVLYIGTIIGNCVTIGLVSEAPANPAAAKLTLSTLPAVFRPVKKVTCIIPVINNNAKTSGLAVVNVNGTIDIHPSVDSTSVFTAGADAALGVDPGSYIYISYILT